MMGPRATSLLACLALGSVIASITTTVAGCASRPPAAPGAFVQRTVSFRPERLVHMDSAAREAFSASLRSTFAANGLDLQNVRYRNVVDMGANGQSTSVETFEFAWARVLPFLVGDDRNGPIYASDYGTCTIQLSERHSFATVDCKTADQTRETWTKAEAPRRLRTTDGDLVTRDELAQQRDETTTRVHTALSAALPEGRFRESIAYRMDCFPTNNVRLTTD